MGSREQLGAADVTDAQLAAMVADLLHQDDVELLDSRRRRRRLRPARHHHRRPVVGFRARGHLGGEGAVPVLRQAGAVVGAVAVVPVRAGGAPRDGGRQRAVEDRGGGLPLRPGPAAARRPDGAPRARRLRPRRGVVVDVAGGGSGPGGDVGPAAVRAGGVPPRPALRQSGSGAPGRSAPRRVVDEHLQDRSAGGPGGADPDERRGVAAPALRALRRRAPRPGCVPRRPTRPRWPPRRTPCLSC